MERRRGGSQQGKHVCEVEHINAAIKMMMIVMIMPLWDDDDHHDDDDDENQKSPEDRLSNPL